MPENIEDNINNSQFKRFDERSEEVKEIINKKPDIVERYALLIFMFFLVILLISSKFIKYNEAVDLPFVLIGDQAPQEVISNEEGKLVFLNKQDSQYVHTGDIIGWSKTNTNFSNVVKLYNRINAVIELLDSNKLDNNELYKCNKELACLDFGEFENSYYLFKSNLKKIEDMSHLFLKNRIDKTFSKEYENRIMEEINAAKQKIYIKKQEIGNWLNAKSIIATINGQIKFIPYIKNDYIVKHKEVLGYIVPSCKYYYAKMKISQKNIGKIHFGMRIQLNFDAYPYQQNGYILATLEYISPQVSDGFFDGYALLKEGLTTNRNISIVYRSGLQGNAMVISNRVPIWDKIFRTGN